MTPLTPGVLATAVGTKKKQDAYGLERETRDSPVADAVGCRCGNSQMTCEKVSKNPRVHPARPRDSRCVLRRALAPAQAGGAERRNKQRCRQRLRETVCLETDAREPAEFAHQKPQNATESSGSEGLERAAVFTGHSALPGVCSSKPNPGKLSHRCGRTDSKTYVGSKAILKKNQVEGFNMKPQGAGAAGSVRTDT